MLWQLARIVGLVAKQRRGSFACPPLWQERYPVLHRLFAQLESLLQPRKKRIRAGVRPSRRTLVSRPSVVWQVDLQQVVAILREQTFPSDFREVRWRVQSGTVSQPQVWTHENGVRIEETSSHALGPMPLFHIEVEMRGRSSSRTESCRIELPNEFMPCVLFAPDGTMLGVADDSVFPPGEYLALVRREGADNLFQCNGVRPLIASTLRRSVGTDGKVGDYIRSGRQS